MLSDQDDYAVINSPGDSPSSPLHTPHSTPTASAINRSAIEVAEAADVLSVHVALTEDTRGLAGHAFFGAVREGSIFISTLRAEVVDEAVLAWAVQERGIKAGLDVCEGEPSSGTGTIENPLFHWEALSAHITSVSKHYRRNAQSPPKRYELSVNTTQWGRRPTLYGKVLLYLLSAASSSMNLRITCANSCGL